MVVREQPQRCCADKRRRRIFRNENPSRQDTEGRSDEAFPDVTDNEILHLSTKPAPALSVTEIWQARQGSRF